MDKPIDIIMWAGEEHYTVSSFIEEAERMGVSKRIPRTAIPEGIVPGQSRILIKHQKAIVHSESFEELLAGLYTHGAPEYSLPDDMLEIVMFLENLQDKDRSVWNFLVEEYALTWTSGVIGYSYITSIQYIAYDNEEDLPEDLQHLEGYVEPVRIEYEEERE